MTESDKEHLPSWWRADQRPWTAAETTSDAFNAFCLAMERQAEGQYEYDAAEAPEVLWQFLAGLEEDIPAKAFPEEERPLVRAIKEIGDARHVKEHHDRRIAAIDELQKALGKFILDYPPQEPTYVTPKTKHGDLKLRRPDQLIADDGSLLGRPLHSSLAPVMGSIESLLVGLARLQDADPKPDAGGKTTALARRLTKHWAWFEELAPHFDLDEFFKGQSRCTEENRILLRLITSSTSDFPFGPPCERRRLKGKKLIQGWIRQERGKRYR